MGSIESMLMVMMMVLGGGGGGDLLDFTDSGMYWQMREQRVVDVATMSALIADDKASAADKLMAIRTLGEKGSAEDADPVVKAQALTVLAPLATSKEPFVGQYAKRSIAWVKGADPDEPKAATAKQLASDLAILPHTSQIVGQMRMKNGVGPIDLGKLIPKMPGQGGPDRGQMIGQISNAASQAAAMIGNARIDSISVGATFFGNGDDGYAMVVGRGQYDRVGVQLAMEKMAEEEDADLNFYSIGKIEVISSNAQYQKFVIMMPSDELFIFMFGELGDKGAAAFPVDETAELIENGGGDLAFGAKLTKQLKQIDRDKADVWVAMDIPQMFKQHGMEEVFGPFDAGHAYATTNEQGGMDIAWKAEGKDPAAIAKAVTFMNEGVAEGKKEMAEMAQQAPEMKAMFEPMVKIMDTLKIQAKDKTMTGEVKLPGGMGAMMPMWMMGVKVDGEEFQGGGGGGGIVVEDVLEAKAVPARN